MSEVKTDKISPMTSTSMTIGDSGDTFTVPSGATLTVASGGTLTTSNATMTGFTIPSGQTLTIASGATLANSGTATGFDAGLHLEETTAPSTAANVGALYTKDTSGQPELFYREESDGDEIQITSGGALNAGGGLYSWATNMTADTEAADNTITTTEGIGTGITVTLAAGDDIVVHIGEIYWESSDTSNAEFELGIYDGTTFYAGTPVLNGNVSYGVLPNARANTASPNVIRGGNLHASANNAWSGMTGMIFPQVALGLSTSEKTWQLAFKKVRNTGCIILGSTNNAVWSIGVRREST